MHFSDFVDKRLDEFCFEVAQCLVANIVCQKLYNPSLIGAPQLSGEDVHVRETVELLFPYLRDPHLMGALEKQMDDLLDTAWPVIMQWFNEEEDE